MIHSGGIQNVLSATASTSMDDIGCPHCQAAPQTLLVFEEFESAKLQPCSTAPQSQSVRVSGIQQRNCLVPAAFLNCCLEK